MNIRISTFILWSLALFFFLAPAPTHAEGTRQLAPTPSDSLVMLETNRPDFGNFAAFNGPATSRLYISISNPGEVVFLGLSAEHGEDGRPVNNNTFSQYRFRIRRVAGGGADPVVHGPFLVNNLNANVRSWTESLYGNYSVAATQGGNQIYRFAPGQAGDYYIEFEDTPSDGNTRVLIAYWDITVTQAGVPLPGRVWSQNWAFRTPTLAGNTPPDCIWDRPFNGTLYSYTVDGFVSRINFANSGMQGLSFNVAFNSRGPGNTGDAAQDRRSVPGQNATATAAQHKIFLNEPDIAVFPDGECGQINPASTFRCVGDDGFCLDVSVTKPGQVNVIIDFNQNGQFDAESQDVVLVAEFDANNLSDCILWDGLRGDGTPIAFGDTVDLLFIYSQGIQHWAAYDVEYLKNGFCVESIRPACSPEITSNILYWDDRSLMTEPGTGQVLDGRNGCECGVDGCRTWNNFIVPGDNCAFSNDDNTSGYGDKSTLNTWWFASTRTVIRANIPIVACQVSGPDTVCVDQFIALTAQGSGSSQVFTYSWSGPNGFTADTPTVSVSDPGQYCVTVTDANNCQSICCKDITQIGTETGLINYPAEISACFGESVVLSPTGDTNGLLFNWSPQEGLSDPASPSPVATPTSETVYTVIVSDVNGCQSPDTVRVLVGPPIGLEVDGDLSTCDSTTLLTASAAVPATFAWYDAAGNQVANTASYNAPVSGYSAVSVIATDGLGCMDTLVLILSGGPVDVSLPDTVAVCEGEQIDLTALNLDPNDTLTYAWSPVALFAGGTDTASPDFNEAVGAYRVYVTVTNQFGCIATDSVQVAVIDDDISLSFTSEVLCDGATVVFTNTSTNAFGYLWLFGDGQTSTEVNPIHVYGAPGTYEVTLRTVYDVDCAIPFIDTLEVEEPQLVADFSFNYEACATDSLVVAFTDQSFVSQGSTITNWAWTFSSNPTDTLRVQNPVVTFYNSEPVIVTLQVTASNGCVSTTSDTLDIQLVDWQLPDTLIRCLGDTLTLNPNGNPANTYLWSPATGLSSTTIASPLAFPDVTTTYQVLITSVLGADTCSSVQEVTVFVPQAIDLDLGADIVNCGETVTLTANTAVGATIRWFSRLDDFISDEVVLIYSATDVDTLFAQATDSYGCSELDTIIITNNGVGGGLDMNGETIVCRGEELTVSWVNLNPDDTHTFTWSPEEYIMGPTDQPSAVIVLPEAGTVVFTTTATNQHGCSRTISFTVTATDFNPPLPSNDTVYVCENIPTEINPDGDNTLIYEWAPLDEAIDVTTPWNPIVTTDTTRTYIVTVTDPIENCQVIDTVVVLVYPPINLDLSPDLVTTCGEDVVLTATADVAVTIQWISAVDGPLPGNGLTITVNPFRADTITAIATDANGCSESASVIVIDNGVDVTPDPGAEVEACQYVATTLSLINEDELDTLSYTWSPAEYIVGPANGSSVTIVVDEPGTVIFTAIVSNQNSCTDTVQFTVTVQNFDADLPALVQACPNTPTPINPEGNPAYTYVWSPTTGLDLSQPWNPVATLTQSQLYYATITDPTTGCFTVDSVQVQVLPDVNLQTTGDTVLCEIVPVTLTATTSTPAGIVWQNAAGVVIGAGSPFVTTPVNGINTYVAIATDLATGCRDTSIVVVNVMTLGDDLPADEIFICANEPTPINPGGNPNLIYTWTPADEAIDLTQPWNPVVTTNTPRTYFVRIEDPVFGCVVFDTVNIIPYPAMNLNAGDDQTICTPDAPVTLTATTDAPAAVIRWYDEQGAQVGTGSSLTLTPPAGQHFYVAEAVSLDGCTERDTVVIFNFPILATLTPALVICEPVDSLQLNVTFLNDPQQPIITWDPAGVLTDPANGPSVWVDPNVTDEFFVDIVNLYGCSLSLSTTVTVIDLPGTLTLTANPDTILIGESSTLTVAGGCIGCTYEWDAPSGSINGTGAVVVVTPAETGPQTYTVIVRLLDCVWEEAVTIFVVNNACDGDHVFLPNAFTPNGDGSNDILRIRSNYLDELEVREFMIYNRWGEEIFRTNDPFQGWDGRYRDEECAPDVYGFYLETVCPNGEVLIQKGNITLLR